MQTMFLDATKAVYNSSNHTYTFPYPVYPGLALCDNCVGKIPISGGILSGSAGVVVSSSSPHNITVSAGHGAGTFTITKASPNVMTLNT